MKAFTINKKNDLGLLTVRLTIGLLILLHGIANLTSGYIFIKDLLSGIGIPAFIAYGVFLGEIVAPILIILGYRARFASLVLAFNMLAAIFLAHASDIFSLNQFGGWGIELQALYLFGALAIFFTGAGAYALSTKSVWD